MPSRLFHHYPFTPFTSITGENSLGAVSAGKLTVVSAEDIANTDEERLSDSEPLNPLTDNETPRPCRDTITGYQWSGILPIPLG